VKAAAVDVDVARIGLCEVLLVDLRLGGLDHRRNGLVATGRSRRVIDRGRHLPHVNRLARLARLLLQPAAARDDRGVDGILIDLAAS